MSVSFLSLSLSLSLSGRLMTLDGCGGPPQQTTFATFDSAVAFQLIFK